MGSHVSKNGFFERTLKHVLKDRFQAFLDILIEKFKKKILKKNLKKSYLGYLTLYLRKGFVELNSLIRPGISRIEKRFFRAHSKTHFEGPFSSISRYLYRKI